MKIISPSVHGIIDYLVVIFLLAAPSLFDLSDTGTQWSFTLAGIHLALTVATKFKFGLLKVIPFKLHGIIELIVGIALVASPFVLGYDGVDKLFYMGFGLAVLLVWLLTDY